MVKFSAGLDRTFAALADPTRRGILARLAGGEASVMELAGPCDMSVPAVAKHLRVLTDAGLIATEKTGRVRRCRLTPAPLQSAAEWLTFYQRFWADQLDRLGDYLDHITTREQTWPGTTPQRDRASRSGGRSGRRSRSSSKR